MERKLFKKWGAGKLIGVRRQGSWRHSPSDAEGFITVFFYMGEVELYTMLINHGLNCLVVTYVEV